MVRRIWIGIACIVVGVYPGGMAAAQTPEAERDITEVTLEDDHVQFTFSYPADWVSDELESPFLAIQLANSEDLIERNLLGGEELPILQTGEIWAAVFLADQRQFPDTGDLANESSIADTADFAAQIYFDLLQDLDVCGTQINDRPAGLISGHFGDDEGFDFFMILVDMGINEDRREFGQILALSGLGEMDDHLPTLLDMAETMDVLDDGEVRPLDEIESAAELPECEFEALSED